ncbi:MAG: hypothetical protein SGILL_009317, partial [Bacillariaceae sp.]
PAFYSFFGLDKYGQQGSNSDSESSTGSMYNLMESASNVVTGILRIPTGVVIAPKTPARIEPKTYFANERTFVQWVSTSILLLNISGFMLEAGAVGDYNTTAAPRIGDGSSKQSVMRIADSRLKGLATVGDRLFAVSDGPERIELVEMEGRSDLEKLRVVGRWTLADGQSKIDGFASVLDSFYINIDSEIQVYSVPNDFHRPMKLKSLNTKAFSQQNSHVSTMTTFEGVTYMLEPNKNVLEAWYLTEGMLFAEIQLPEIDNFSMQWTGFALERKKDDGTLAVHLMTGEGRIWSFPAVEDFGHFSVPNCQVETSIN